MKAYHVVAFVLTFGFLIYMWVRVETKGFGFCENCHMVGGGGCPPCRAYYLKHGKFPDEV